MILLFWGSLAAFEPFSPRRRWVAGGLYAVTALAVLSGYSHTAKVVCLAAPIVFLATLRLSGVAVRLLAWGFVGLFLLAPVLAGVPWSLATRPGGLADSEGEVSARATHRVVIWEYSQRRIAERPILGWGLGASPALAALQQTAHQALDEDLPEAWGELRVIDGGHPHSLPLLIWLETGAIGTGLCVALLWVGLRRIDRVEDPWSKAALLTLTTSILLFFCLNYPAWHPTMVALWVMTAGLAAALVPSSAACAGHDGIVG